MGTRIGSMKCINPACSCTDVAVEVTGAGTWQMKCHVCGLPSFGKAGTRWRRQMETMVTLDDEPGDPEPPAPRGDPKPEPVKKPARSVFDLGQLA